MNDIPTTSCDTCGQPTWHTGTRRCTNCWEVEHRIRDYVKSVNGRKFLLKALGTIDIVFLKRWIGKERARFDRMGKNTESTAGRERAFGEANVCSLILGKINADLRKLKE